MKDMIYLGIDFGLRRIGLAKSDPTGLIASAYKTITYKSIKKAVGEIVADIEELGAVGVVVGYPVAPDGGNKGERCRMVDDFIVRLEKVYSGPIYKYDERFSSVEAEDMIHKHGKKIGRDKGRVDRMAAALILQRFLDER
ncbi:MAG: Holliday junction resolvase RuvX [candidate division Zixibacteria bacterium HGW-Zixibacteria-1]|nr:MAG: Holliday junction resolvase RuvX [candidate division Zixibacteria bacterium HGW-Zixibacteria-1]